MKLISICFILMTGMVGCHTSNGGLSYPGLNECPQVAKIKQVGNSMVTVCEPDLLKDTIVLPLSYFTEELQMVKLDNNPKALVSETNVIIGNLSILVRTSWFSKTPSKLFDKSGHYIANIGAFGKGPNEYDHVEDQQVDEKNNRIYLLPLRSDRISVYDLKGNYLAPIPLPYRVSKGKINVDQDNSSVSVMTLPLIEGHHATTHFVWTQNMQGEVIHGLAPRNLSVEPKHVLSFNNLFSLKNTNEQDLFIFTWLPRQDTLYHYDTGKNQLIPQFTLDFSNRKIPIHYYIELPRHYLGRFMDPAPVEGGWITTNNRYYLVEKTTLKGAYFKLVNDFLGNIEIEAPNEVFYNGHYVANYEPSNLLEKLENALSKENLSAEMRKKLTDLKNSIKETDNNYILYAKLK